MSFDFERIKMLVSLVLGFWVWFLGVFFLDLGFKFLDVIVNFDIYWCNYENGYCKSELLIFID